MRGILIDSENRKVSEVEFKTLEEMKKIMRIEWVTTGADLKKRHTLWVDDEGLLNHPQHFFAIDGGYQPYAGNGFITGMTPQGDMAKCTLSVQEVEAMVHYLTLADVQECIRRGIVDYNSYYAPMKEGTMEPDMEKREVITKIDLGAFCNEDRNNVDC